MTSLETLLFGRGIRSLKPGLLIYNLYHTAGHKGQAKTGGPKSLGRRARSRRKKREPGRGYYDKTGPPSFTRIDNLSYGAGTLSDTLHPRCRRKMREGATSWDARLALRGMDYAGEIWQVPSCG